MQIDQRGANRSHAEIEVGLNSGLCGAREDSEPGTYQRDLDTTEIDRGDKNLELGYALSLDIDSERKPKANGTVHARRITEDGHLKA